MGECRYCNEDYQSSERTVLKNYRFFANYDSHPVSRGHMKLLPQRHVNSIADLTADELIAMRDLLAKAKEMINERYHPDGYNISANEGTEAGQTVPHLHIHLIPRYKGDAEEPAGGVRNVIPGKGNYLKNSKKD